MSLCKLHTVRDEIIKWLLNEGYITSIKRVSRMSHKELVSYYMSKTGDFDPSLN